MPRFLCTVSNVSNQTLFQAGQVYELVANPNEDFFQVFNDDIKREILGGFQRDLDGTLYLPGGGWDDLTYPATGINPPGATSDPSRSTVDGLLEFSASATNIIAGVSHLPHRKAFGTKVNPHIHWYPATTAEGDVVWRFEYKVCPVGEAIPADYTVIDKTQATPKSLTHMLSPFGPIDVQDNDLGVILMWKLSRLGADEADTYEDVARLIEFDIHFWQDSIGSGTEHSK